MYAYSLPLAMQLCFYKSWLSILLLLNPKYSANIIKIVNEV